MILNPITHAQTDYIRNLQKRHRVSDDSMDALCRKRHGVPLAGIDKWQASQLIDEMKKWEDVPVEIRRATGQLDLFGEMAS